MRSRFPDPRSAPPDAPLAWGGDLEPETLVDAYAHGIFPWPSEDGTLWWWSPDPRAVFDVDAGLHVSRTLRRRLRREPWHAVVDGDFVAVVDACADRRPAMAPGSAGTSVPADEGTWITPALRDAYVRLHHLGIAHSLEVRDDGDRLVGGVYGVALGGAFMGESMFHRTTDASKAALVMLVDHLRGQGFRLFDVQLPTAHLRSLGARTVARGPFLAALGDAVALDRRF